MGERRIAAFGGTFDPVHNGHVEIARAIVHNFGLDQLLIVPAHRPPHKDPRAIADAYHRYAMAALATLDEQRMIVSTIELESPERSYTFETIERLQSAVGEGTRLFFVMGADSFQEINTWREPARLLSATDVIVVTRPGHDVKSSHLDGRFKHTVVELGERNVESAMAEDGCHHIYVTGYVNNSVSSTEIRRRVREGQSIAGLVPPRVADYINKYKLYRC
jgi:nicotinate-nucleotide adenylyltransferase